MRIHRVRTRIVLFFVALIALVQGAGFWLVNAANTRNAQAKVEEELVVGQKVFASLLEQNAEKLSQAARVLASDFPFREAVATHDKGTIVSVLTNHGARIGADAMLFIGLDGEVVADTLLPNAPAHAFKYPALLVTHAGDKQIAGANTSLQILEGKPLQLVATPVLAPLQIGWVVMGFTVDNSLALELRRLTSLEVSFFRYDSTSGWQPLASTLSTAGADQLRKAMPSWREVTTTHALSINGEDNQARLIPLGSGGTTRIVAVLHRSLASALAAFERLRNTLTALAILSLLISIVASVAIALNITKPLSSLAVVAGKIEQGDYADTVVIERADEIGVLASSLKHMRRGIKEREQRILKLAYQDTLTDLANRSKFSERLQGAIAAASKTRQPLSILVMDLDRFKYVNDTLGHGVGDHVLREVAQRLLRIVGSAECVARLGGDEFAVLLQTPDRTEAEISRQIITALEQPIHYQGQPLDVGTSIGIAHYPEHGDDAETLVRNADIAMYVAKRNKTGFASYDPNYDTTQQEHLSLLGELRRAVERNELRLHYQPKVSLRSENVSAVEALLRWEHPQRGMVAPALFIPFAEHTGYIKVLTRWVLQEAIRQCGEWLQQGLRLQISVNISARDLMNRELPDMIRNMLAQYDVPSSLLCLEITESGFMEDPAHAQKVLDRLSALGLKLSIDDYGTGYSSLSYIMKLPVQELKIDQSFIRNMVGNDDLSTIVRSTIELGHNLGLMVVAEGVEDAAAWKMLQALGCDDAQGYYMSRPLDAVALVHWVKAREGIVRTSAAIATPA
jgi:diguanylate cyclase (GGDEF)-like protein